MNNIILDKIDIEVNDRDLTGNIFNYDRKNIKELLNSIKNITKNFCLKNNINFDLQRYKISGNIIESESDSNWYSLCSGKFFNFFGKYYLDNSALEIFKNKNGETYEYELHKNDIILCMHHFYNKTISNNSKYIEFYIAPSVFLEHFDDNEWTIL